MVSLKEFAQYREAIPAACALYNVLVHTSTFIACGIIKIGSNLCPFYLKLELNPCDLSSVPPAAVSAVISDHLVGSA